MFRFLIALPLLLGFVQDEAALRELIRRLDDSELEVRDKALNELVAAGEKSLALLKQAMSSDSAEVRARATQAIQQIEHKLKSRAAYPDHKPLSLKKSGTVGEILDDLARLSGVKVEASPEQRGLKADVNASTLLQALDQVCAGKDNFSYSFSDDGAAKFSSDRHIAFPAAYAEAFKVYVASVDVARRTDYKDTTVTGGVSIHTAWDARLKPLKRVRYESLKGQDDGGREIELVPGGWENGIPLLGGGGGAAFVMAGFGDGGDSSGPQSFGLKGLAPESKSLKSLKGILIVSFPLSRADVVFDDPQGGLSQAVGDFTIKLNRVSLKDNRITMTFTRTKGETPGLRDEVMGRMEAGSVKVVDENGKVHDGDFGVAGQEAAGGMVIIGGPGGEPAKSAKFAATFPSLEGKDIKKLTFRFSESLFEKAFEFEIKDVKLP